MNYDFSPIQKELTELYSSGFPSPYTIQETAAVFQLYLELFEMSTGGVHPPIGKTQVRRMAVKMPYFEGSQLEQLVTSGLTVAASLAAWWKNNSFTPAAIKADQTLKIYQSTGK